MKGDLLGLCAGSGAWERPYEAAGYNVIKVTLPTQDVRTYKIPPGVRPVGVLAAPPCDQLSMVLSEKIKRNVAGALEVVNACLRIVDEARARVGASASGLSRTRRRVSCRGTSAPLSSSSSRGSSAIPGRSAPGFGATSPRRRRGSRRGRPASLKILSSISAPAATSRTWCGSTSRPTTSSPTSTSCRAPRRMRGSAL